MSFHNPDPERAREQSEELNRYMDSKEKEREMSRKHFEFNEVDVTLARQRLIEFIQGMRSQASRDDLSLLIRHDLHAAQIICELEEKLEEIRIGKNA
jgi:hypothetical protein